MTKKSNNRLMKDQAKKQQSKTKNIEVNNCFIELQDCYRNCAQMLAGHGVILQVTTDQILMSYVEDKKTFYNRLELLAKDIVQLSNELAQLYTQHKDKNGMTSNPDEIMLAFTIGQQYSLFMERHAHAVMPNAENIIAQIRVAEAALLSTNITAQQEALLDPNVISDVEVK